MEVASSDDVGLVEVLDRLGRGLDVHFSSYVCGKEVPSQSSLASGEERSQCEKVEVSTIVWLILVETPLLPGEVGLYSRPSTIHDGPSLMADLIERTLVNVSSRGWRV